MSEPTPQSPRAARRPLPSRPDVIVIPHRPSSMPRGLAWPLLLIVVAGLGLAIRASISDWRGLFEEARSRVAAAFSRKPAAPPPQLARADRPARANRPVETNTPATPPVAQAPPAAVEGPKRAWDDIRDAAEKKQAERAELEKIKEKAAEDLARTPPPPDRIRRPNPALLAQMQQRQIEALRQMQQMQLRGMRDLAAGHHQQFERMIREHNERMREFERAFGGNFGMGVPNRPFPGFDRAPAFPNFGPVLIDPPDLPPGATVHEDSGEEVKDGVRRTWRKRVVIVKSSAGLFGE